jgi:hypothetical protein
VIEAGTRHNPFFGFYETPRIFKIRMRDGSSKDLNAIYWLEQVEAGNINPDNLPLTARLVAQHFQILSRELTMELVRRDVAPQAPSRQTCLWAADTLEQAHRWFARLEGQKTLLRLSAAGVVHRADASLLSADAEPYSAIIAKAERYWRGEMGDNPEYETLFSGTATVVEVLRA